MKLATWCKRLAINSSNSHKGKVMVILYAYNNTVMQCIQCGLKSREECCLQSAAVARYDGLKSRAWMSLWTRLETVTSVVGAWAFIDTCKVTCWLCTPFVMHWSSLQLSKDEIADLRDSQSGTRSSKITTETKLIFCTRIASSWSDSSVLVILTVSVVIVSVCSAKCACICFSTSLLVSSDCEPEILDNHLNGIYNQYRY